MPGTQSSRATQLANATFGPSQLIPILLEGPKAQLNKQGPKLVRALAGRPHTRVLSAWDAGTASEGLRPKPTAAMMVVAVDRSEKDVVQYDEPQIESLVILALLLVTAVGPTQLMDSVGAGAVACAAFALRSGQESPNQLPASSKARVAYDEISRMMGPG